MKFNKFVGVGNINFGGNLISFYGMGCLLPRNPLCGMGYDHAFFVRM